MTFIELKENSDMTAKPEPEILDLQTKARTERKEFRLGDFVTLPDVYCHRDADALKREAVGGLMDSLALEGLNTALEVVLDEKKRPVIIKGHRRLAAMRFLVEDNHPRFKPETKVRADVVLDATEEDLLLRSVLDNETRKNLNPIERCRVVKTLHDAGVPVQRAAAALGISVKTYQRDLLVIEYPWMFDLVVKDRIPPTTAAQLLEAAKREDRVEELHEDLQKWVAHTEEKIQERQRLQKLKDGKDLPPAKTQVKNYLPRDLLEHWLGQLRRKERLAMSVKWDFVAGLDPDANRLKIEGIELDLAKAPLPHVAKVIAKLSHLQHGAMEYLTKRAALESAQGPQAAVRETMDQPYDLQVLRSAGLGDLADELEQETVEGGEEQDDSSSSSSSEDTPK
jgi:ParB-like chromosome segregation protein Spo0J